MTARAALATGASFAIAAVVYIVLIRDAGAGLGVRVPLFALEFLAIVFISIGLNKWRQSRRSDASRPDPEARKRRE